MSYILLGIPEVNERMAGPAASDLSSRPSPPGTPRPLRPFRPFLLGALLAGGAAVVTVLFRYDPATADFFPPCPFRLLTGLQCPGCGSTRAFHQLLHGHLGAALALNPLLPLYLAALGWLGLTVLCEAAGLPAPPAPRLSAAWIWALLVLIVGFGVVRNLPFDPPWPHLG